MESIPQYPDRADNSTIVVIHPGALGDVLLSLPALRRLGLRHPGHPLCLCANDQVGRLLVACREVDRWLSVERSVCAELFSGSVSTDSELFQWLAQCDLAVAWLEDRDGLLKAILERYASRVIVCSPFAAKITATHQRDRFLHTIDEQPDQVLGPTPLSLPDDLVQRGSICLVRAGIPIDRPLVLIHPGSGSLHKCVSPRILDRVIQGLRNQGTVPILLQGPADFVPVDSLLRLTSPVPFVLRDLDLLTVAGVLRQIGLFIGHDSGIAHLSALLGVPTLALFGPTDSQQWAPSGHHVKIVKGSSCTCSDWQLVRRCEGKPCLDISAEDILSWCRIHTVIGRTL
ncbi:MAG TPA: glycosyltransferase family 9 protein [Nitrospira sp.]|nr:glycosyltransferase family 9 protein [Nitrospira sp.]